MPGTAAAPKGGLIMGCANMTGCCGIMGMPVPAGGIPNPAPGCPTDGGPAPGGTELVGGTAPCKGALDGTPADQVAGATFGCQLAPPVNFFSPAFH